MCGGYVGRGASKEHALAMRMAWRRDPASQPPSVELSSNMRWAACICRVAASSSSPFIARLRRHASKPALQDIITSCKHEYHLRT